MLGVHLFLCQVLVWQRNCRNFIIRLMKFKYAHEIGKLHWKSVKKNIAKQKQAMLKN